MAVVYRARHNQLGTSHAIKVLTIPSASIRLRLVQEGRVQAGMQHPNVVSVTDVIEVEGAPGLVMELIRGPPLDRLLELQRLTLDQIDTLVPGILAGVSAAHARGLVHRDLKPQNILIAMTAAGPVAKIADFGLAKVLDAENSATHTRSGMQMGTPAYMAPEQVRNAKGVDHRADVFALGAVLYEICSGARAFDGEDLLEIYTAIGAGRYTPIQSLVPDLPDRMVRAIEGALIVDREKRIPSVDALLAVWHGGASAGPQVTGYKSGPFSADVFAAYQDEPIRSVLGNSGVTFVADGDAETLDTRSVEGSLLTAGAPPVSSVVRGTLVPVSGDLGSIAPTQIAAPTAARVVEPAEVRGSSGWFRWWWALPVVASGAVATVLAGVVGLGSLDARPTPDSHSPVDAGEARGPPPALGPSSLPAAGTTPPAEVIAPSVESVPPLPSPAQPSPPKRAPAKAALPTPAARPVDSPPPEVASPGTLRVSSRPWSNVILDGQAASRTGNWSRELPAGRHTIELSASDGKRHEQVLEVRAAQTTTFCWDFDLARVCP